MKSKWTKEKCLEEALKYKNRADYQRCNRSSYNSALKNKWLDEICSHMILQQKPNGYWSKDKCQIVSLKYETRMDFFNKDSGVYSKCVKEKWLDNICKHMRPKKLRNYWNKDNCILESLKYKTRKEFSKKSPRAYQLCVVNGWLESCGHLKVKSYTKEYCKEESEKYKTLKELINNNSYLYNKILKNDWSNEMFSHMIQTGNLYKRCIYAYEFSDNYVYVGLTFNLNERNNNHMKRGPVKKHINETQNIPKLIKLTDYINIENAKNKEKEYLDKYINNGWIILNKSKTGGLGSYFRKWTKEKCVIEALKCKTRYEYFQNSASYHFARKNGWIDEICSHMRRYTKTIKT
jgi:predicted GIY-YIG superfamily endonuclease